MALVLIVGQDYCQRYLGTGNTTLLLPWTLLLPITSPLSTPFVGGLAYLPLHIQSCPLPDHHHLLANQHDRFL
jgi:hypothetical protein